MLELWGGGGRKVVGQRPGWGVFDRNMTGIAIIAVNRKMKAESKLEMAYSSPAFVLALPVRKPH